MFNSKFQFNILKCYTDPEGRFNIADVETEEKILTLVNIYPPDRDDLTFFRGVSEKMLSFESDLIGFGGDFNLVCDVEKDKKRRRSYYALEIKRRGLFVKRPIPTCRYLANS